jgi:hypothetical protein
MTNYPHEHDVLRLSSNLLRDTFPKISAQKAIEVAELLNRENVRSPKGRTWTPSNISFYLNARRKPLSLLLNKPLPPATRRKKRKFIPRRRRSLVPIQTKAALPSLTQAALNGSGDLVRAILSDTHLRAERKLEMICTYLEEASRRG